jgi:hypothetical protein
MEPSVPLPYFTLAGVARRCVVPVGRFENLAEAEAARLLLAPPNIK